MVRTSFLLGMCGRHNNLVIIKCIKLHDRSHDSSYRMKVYNLERKERKGEREKGRKGERKKGRKGEREKRRNRETETEKHRNREREKGRKGERANLNQSTHFVATG